ncbi:MAG: DUF4384 domain-containing protein [Spirochaetia bacterium]|jgi:hypothetical protein
MLRKRIAALLLTACASLLGTSFLGGEGAKLAFNWAFVSQAADGSAAPIDFSEHVSIKPGELFKIDIEPVQNAFVYLYLHDAAGDLSLLFPQRFEMFEGKSYVGTSILIPDGKDWFQFDGTKGTERFYLLASTQRLRTVEALTLTLQRVKDNPKSTGSEKAAARQAVLDEIARVRKQHSQLTIAAEKPVTVAGSTRGMKTSVEKLASRIEATEFYAKTFRLDH